MGCLQNWKVKIIPQQTWFNDRLVHAFIRSDLDYCNCLFAGLPNSHIAPLQRIQDTAAMLVTRTKKSEHITPVLTVSKSGYRSIKGSATRYLLLVYKIYHKHMPMFTYNIMSPSASASTTSSTKRLSSAVTANLSYKVLVPALLLDTAIVPSLQ